MDIKKLSDLGKIMSLCRKKGIESFKISDNSVEFKLSAEEPKRKSKSKEPEFGPQSEQYSPEQIMLWSSQGMPDDAFEGN